MHLFRFSKNKYMKTLQKISLFALVSILFISCKKEGQVQEEVIEHKKIVSLSGAITETLVALGQEEKIVGVDVTSTYPQYIKDKAKDLGHVKVISAENVIALQPTLVLASDKDLSPELITKLQTANIQVKIIHQEQSIEGTKQFIKDIATAIGSSVDYSSLIKDIDTNIAKMIQFESKPKVLFIYARGAGAIMVAGRNTPMEKMIEIAGGQNVVRDFEDFKPLTPESLIRYNPDYILLFDKGLKSIGGIEGLLKVQGIEQTIAGKNKQIISMDGAFLSGFGPRVGQAARELNQLLSKQ